MDALYLVPTILLSEGALVPLQEDVVQKAQPLQAVANVGSSQSPFVPAPTKTLKSLAIVAESLAAMLFAAEAAGCSLQPQLNTIKSRIARADCVAFISAGYSA